LGVLDRLPRLALLRWLARVELGVDGPDDEAVMLSDEECTAGGSLHGVEQA
jgi:hypothetical protein